MSLTCENTRVHDNSDLDSKFAIFSTQIVFEKVVSFNVDLFNLILKIMRFVGSIVNKV